MSFTRVTLCASSAASTSTSTVFARAIQQPCRRGYAAASSSQVGSRKKTAEKIQKGNRSMDMSGDGRLDSMKQILFNHPTGTNSDSERLERLAKVVPSIEVHETITRAYRLFLRQKREATKAALEAKYDSMRKALDLLEETDKELFVKATREAGRLTSVNQEGRRNERLAGLVPREYKVPLELGPLGEDGKTGLWDYDWVRPAAKA